MELLTRGMTVKADDDPRTKTKRQLLSTSILLWKCKSTFRRTLWWYLSQLLRFYSSSHGSI